MLRSLVGSEMCIRDRSEGGDNSVSFWGMSALSHRVVPSANALDEPGMCDDSKHHPVFTSSTPSHLIMNAARGSRVPPHRLTQETADKLSPRMRTGSPAMEGRSSLTTFTYAVTTIASSSKRLFDSLLWEAQVVCSDERCCSSIDKSYHHQTRDSQQNPPNRVWGRI